MGLIRPRDRVKERIAPLQISSLASMVKMIWLPASIQVVRSSFKLLNIICRGLECGGRCRTCCSKTEEGPELRTGRYAEMTLICLFFPLILIQDHLPRFVGSFPESEILYARSFVAMIAVPPY